MNMVRAGVVKHPEEWAHSGYNEIQNPRKRYNLIDHKKLMKLLNFSNYDSLKQFYRKWIDDTIERSRIVRDSKWSQGIAVGDKEFINKTKERLGDSAKGRECIKSGDTYQLRESVAVYGNYQDSSTDNTLKWNIYN